MKFRYNGQDNCFCLELLAFKIMDKSELLKKGMVFDVPDDNTAVISALDNNGLFERVNTTTKKVKKEEKKE